MGTIKTTYNRTNNLTTFKVAGKMTASDFYDGLAHYYEGNVTQLTLWDLTEADLSAIDTDEISDFASYARHLAEARQGGRTAVVVGGSFEFGLARMFETHLEIGGLPIEINSYRSLAEAMKWLGCGGDDDC